MHLLSFHYKSPDATSEDAKSAADEILELLGTITGSGEDVGTKFSDTAAEFTDMIASEIKTAGIYNASKWQSAAMAVIHAGGVANKWSSHLEDYKTAISNLKAEAEDAKTRYLGASGKTSDVDKIIKYNAEIRELNGRAGKAWAGLVEDSDGCSNLLRQGPTESAMKVLVAEGGIGWLPYNVLGAEMPIPVDASDGKKMGKEMEKYLDEDGKVIDDRYYEIVAALNAVNARALVLAKRGDNLSEKEIGFLQSFFEELEKLDSDPRTAANEGTGYSEGVLSIPERLSAMGAIDESGQIDDKWQGFIEGIGTGLLVLSDETLGGNFKYVPDSVANALYGPQSSYYLEKEGAEDLAFVHGEQYWREDMRNLSVILGESNDETQGGAKFSRELTATVGANIDTLMNDNNPGSPAWPEFHAPSEEQLESLVDVSTRNKSANHAILTGEGGTYETDTKDVLEGLFTYAWEDEGAAVSGLTDWISEDALSDLPSVRERAGEAAAGLVEQITSKDMFAKLVSTGETVTEQTPDGPITYENASFTALNPEVASSLGDIFVRYVDSFAFPTGQGDVAFEHSEGYDGDPQIRIAMEEQNSIDFMQFLMGDTETAAKTVDTANKYSTIMMDIGAASGEPGIAGERVGRLNGMMETALQNDALDRNMDLDEAKERKDNLVAMGPNVVADTASLYPPIGMGVKWAINFATGDIVDAVVEEAPHQSERETNIFDRQGMKTQSDLIVLDTAIESDSENIERMSEKDRETLKDAGILVPDSDGELHVELSENKLQELDAEEREDVDRAINRSLNLVQVKVEVPDSGAGSFTNSGRHYSDQYLDNFDRKKEDVQDKYGVSDEEYKEKKDAQSGWSW
ncbi:hypothetical protein O4J56_02360 [Nocardiopsis sp. RSe5-2]|uniref:TPR repeat domain-containing protein n=1 Tax=Nocardiopsis endophytica TaxID=3018445 RepID=A0ABT4TXQ7_9ACTN|nr:hypothetical protein [Nocardiopsis endophytica]MDA2809470.1 hypothetical protein [Nocardiopsis endophytica]